MATSDYLPEFAYKTTIKDLLPGEIGYVVPWSIYVREDGAMFINTNASFMRKKRGTSEVGVRKIRAGFEAIIDHNVSFRWSPSSFIPSSCAPCVMTIKSEGE